MPTSAPHPIPTLSALLASLILATGAWAADYAGLVGQARDLLQEDRIVEALAVAKDAVRANGNDYKGHYYVALAYLGMGRFDEADEAARRARSLAPDSARAGVDKLVASIQSRRQGVGSVQAAEAALADGLAGKAARLYEAAWSAGRDNPELGLKAADLYANRLNQPVDAGRVLRQVMQSAKGNPAADRAAGELRKLADSLKKIAQGHVAAAARQQGEEARRSLQLAEEADPGYLPIHQTRARLAARGGDAGALMGAIKELTRRDAAKPKNLSNLPDMAQWLEQAAFAEFMTDLLGDTQVRVLRKMARNPEPDNIIRDCDECPQMVVIPAGSYQMGSEDGNDSEKPVHTVNVSAFALAKTETTVGQFRRFIRATGYRTTAEQQGKCYAVTSRGSWEEQSGRHWDNPGFSQSEDHPVVCVSWDDAKAYVQWLSSDTGETYRLPSEAEWEYAARAGTQSKWVWGYDEHGGCQDANIADLTAKAQFSNWSWAAQCRDGHVYTAPVGSFRANAFGLHDIIGNVWEWTEDCGNSSYGGAPTDGVAWTKGDCGKRVLRGGSWSNSPAYSRAAIRYRLVTTIRDYGFGFRPARIISP